MGLGTSTENMVAKDDPVDGNDDFVVDVVVDGGDIEEKDDYSDDNDNGIEDNEGDKSV